jgi:hypothetical protein
MLLGKFQSGFRDDGGNDVVKVFQKFLVKPNSLYQFHCFAMDPFSGEKAKSFLAYIAVCLNG